MSTNMIRKQFFITVEQDRALKAKAAEVGVSEAELIRAGIELRLAWSDKPVDWNQASGTWADRTHHDDVEVVRLRSLWSRRKQILG